VTVEILFVGRRIRRNVIVRSKKASNSYFSERRSRRHKCFRRDAFDLFSWEQEPSTSFLVEVYLGFMFDRDKMSKFPAKDFKVRCTFCFPERRSRKMLLYGLKPVDCLFF
jgi:hypothetical protein